LVDDGFGRGVALYQVPLQHVFAVSGKWHEVIRLDLELG
jgi:hypothetical protein